MVLTLGNYRQVLAARTTDKEILKNAQDGGIVTALFAYALENDIIDGAIVAGPGQLPWQGMPMVAMNRQELLAAQKTKYNISPNMKLLKEATRSFGLEKVGFVGVPCMLQGLRKAQVYPIAMRDVPDKIALVLGIFCMEVFPYQSMVQLVEDHTNQKLESVSKMEIGKGKFTVCTERCAVTAIPLKVTHKYEQPGCHVCLDYVANLSDISSGSVGTPDGWSTVFVRTKKGEAVWNGAVAEGWFETQPIEQVKPGLDLVTKLATEKITKNKKTLEERAALGVGKGLRNPYLST
ncbi:MAG: coenzyme F420 hydrogenase subunit beta [Methanomicrobiales archaeon]|nr:coenzyme F420 hydrogenase subunit beta [Methanomicrobiales archaeon]MDI6877496.1 coenzyme F420 hydrogenase subunit beta [Methanomicrobiales archaeon]